MKRRMALIWAILAALADRSETIADQVDITQSVMEHNGQYKLNVVQYHIDLCFEAGYISQVGDSKPARLRLTWKGHEALEAHQS